MEVDRPVDRLSDIIYGIRYSVQKADNDLNTTELEDRDYSLEAKDSLNLTRENRPFSFKDYAPKVFATIRKFLGVSVTSFLNSWEMPPEDAEFTESTARSGSMFYITHDRQYLFKTILHPEVTVMMELLRDYHIHLQAYRRTFMVKIYGLFRFMNNSTKLWILIMGHTFPPIITIKEKYDLKGRKPKPGKSIKERMRPNQNAPHKDNEILRYIRFVDEHKSFYLTQLGEDIKLLKDHDIMDYSLLIGIHEVTPEEFEAAAILATQDEGYFSLLPTEIRIQIQQHDIFIHRKTEKQIKTSSEPDSSSKPPKEKPTKKKRISSPSDIKTDNTSPSEQQIRPRKIPKKYPRAKSSDIIQKGLERRRKKLDKKDTGKRLENIHTEIKTIFDYGLVAINPLTSNFEILFLGIIDNLTNYTVSKQMANLFKSALWEPETLSTVPSSYYGDRFYKYLTTDLLGDAPEIASDEDNGKIIITNEVIISTIVDNGKIHSTSQPNVPSQTPQLTNIEVSNSFPKSLTPRENSSSQKSILRPSLSVATSDQTTPKVEKKRKSVGLTRDN